MVNHGADGDDADDDADDDTDDDADDDTDEVADLAGDGFTRRNTAVPITRSHASFASAFGQGWRNTAHLPGVAG